jgi:hypothetical protein
MAQCSANYQVGLVPLAFDIVSTGGRLVNKSVANLDEHINKALQSPKFKDALKKAVREHNDRMFFDSLKGQSKTKEQG